MPNRYVREGIVTSEAVNSLTHAEEVFYRRLMSKVDDFGRYTANAALLRAALFPLQMDRIREADLPRFLAACESSGLLFVYTINSKQFLVINKWERGRAKHSDYPDPPAEVIERMERHVYICKHVRADAPDSDPDPDASTDSDTDTGSVGARARPTIEQAKAAASMLSVSEAEAERWWHAREGSDWLKGTAGGGTMHVGRNWQSDMKSFVESLRETARKNEHRNNGKHHQSEADRDLARTGIKSTAGDGLKRL